MSGPKLGARTARSLRFLRSIKGWRRLAQFLGGRSGAFIVENDGLRFAGNMNTYLDRQVFLFGDYEREHVRLFIGACERRSLVLDIGANAGTHSLAFSRAFEVVHAFEPNSRLWDQFCENMRLNSVENVHLHGIGLSDEAGEFQLYDVDIDNRALATFATVEQYDLPLVPLGIARVEIFDEYLPDLRVDAVKIDVQGLEPNVLRGMRRMLERDRPIVWAEFGSATLGEIETLGQLRDFFPYPIAVSKFCERPLGPLRGTLRLRSQAGERIEIGDYVIRPIA